MSTARALAPPSLVAGCAAAGCALIALGDPTTPGGWLPECPVKALTGVCCPGCGALRMVYSVLHGRIGDAVHYNAVLLVFSGLFAWSLVAWAVGRVRGRAVRTWLDWRWTPWVAGFVLFAWLVARNIPAWGLYV
ncbi:DUF2752 domain-containing protein [Actinokineospora sp. G85]|uniref:DUF2752 domain-containing protein n=1 Tax=Actinokineospora sp. G85 TaxID=3406626 RepID=UPI003C7822BC